MSVWKIAEYSVGIDGPLVLLSSGRDEEKHSRFGSWWLAGIGSKEGGVAPALLPLSRIWDITHPLGVAGNPTGEPVYSGSLIFNRSQNRFASFPEEIRDIGPHARLTIG
ncbi:MAG: hypothetical protein ACYCT9_12735 [Leptospirillum sp.]